MKDFSRPTDATDTNQEAADTGSKTTDTMKMSIRGENANDADDGGTLDAPPEHRPSGAYGEIGDARRAETGPEKTEVNVHRPTKEDLEGSVSPLKEWRPGGPERGG